MRAASARARRVRCAAAAVVAGLAVLAAAGTASAVTTLSFTKAPGLPTLGTVTLTGRSQVTATTWSMTSNFSITSSGTNSGWNLTVGANTAGGSKSAVFKQYCPNATCGTDSGPGYVAGGFTLPAGSLTLDTANAGWTSGTTKPTYRCSINPFCTIDQATPVKVVSASTGVALGTWTSSGSSFLALSTPSTLRKLQTGEVYHVDLVWTLSSGP